MHILLIHQSFVALDEPGGTRHYELASYLAEQGHRVTIITSPVSYLTGARYPVQSSIQSRPEGHPSPILEKKPSITSPQQPGAVTILRTYTYAALHRSFTHRVLAFVSFMISSFLAGMKVREVDLVWGTSPPIFQGLTAWAIAQCKRVPFLFEVRDLWPAFAVAVGVLRQPLLIRASELLERFLYRQADQVVINSPGFREHVETNGARRIELVPNGADTTMFDPSAEGIAFRHRHGLKDKFIVLYAGAHGLSNDLEVVLAAASLVQDQPEVAFVFIGDGKEKPALIRRASELGLTNVTFIPPMPKADIPEALAAANACLGILKPIPMYALVYPNKIFDYLAAGRPVVLAMEGVIREVVEKACAGIPVPPGDPTTLAQAVRTLALNRDLGRSMGWRGHQYVKTHFDRSILAAKLEAILTAMIQL